MKELESKKTKAYDLLGDLRWVGPNKPVGYLPLGTIRDCGISVGKLKKELEEKGLKTKLFRNNLINCCLVGSGALYAYDDFALRELLNKNKSILNGYLPTEPSQFINFIAKKEVPQKTLLFDIVADAFGDKTNPLRTDVDFYGE